MEKLKLDLSDLRVESFATTPSRLAEDGTVFAQSQTMETGCYTCWDTCYYDCDGGTYVGCGPATNECIDTHTSQFNWVSCEHTYCADYTCDRGGTCDTAVVPCNQA